MNVSTLASTVVRLRWLLIAVFAVVTGFFAYQLPNANLDTEMKNQLPRDLPARVNLDRIEELFGGTDMAMVVVSAPDVLDPATLQRLQALSERMEAIPELQRVVSVFTAKDLHGTDGEMVVEPAIDGIPKTNKGREVLRKRLTDNPLVHGNLVSKDFQHTVLIGFLDPTASDEELMGKLHALAREVDGPETIYVGGMPETRVALTRDMRRDMRRFLPVGLLLMLVFLAACFRQASGVILPFIMTVMSIIVAMGLVPLLGWKIHTVTILLPVILLAVANDYGIHLLARYQEDNSPEAKLTNRELAERGVKSLLGPTIACGVTTIIGMLALVTHIIIPAKQLGVLAAVGIGFAMVGSLLFIPAMLAVLPRSKPVLGRGESGAPSKFPLDRLLALVGRVVAKHPRAILITSLIVAVAVGVGATQVVVDTNPMSFYHPSQPVWRSTHLLNNHLGGWAGVSIVVEGDIKDPKVLAEIDALEQHLKQHPKVGTTSSIAGVMRKMNQVMHDGDPAFNRVPETRELIAQYLLLYSMSGDSEDFEKLVDFSYEHAQVMAKVTDSGTTAATDVIAYTKRFTAQRTAGGGPRYMVGGLLDLMADMVHHIVWGQLASMALACGLVCLLVSLFFRSFVAGLLGVSPLILALAVIFGVMGFGGIELNMVTALLSSIMIGVGIDYSIHFLWRYREERRAGLDPEEAVQTTLTTTGRGIVFNAFSVVVGFAVLAISSFFPVRFFGLLVAMSIVASLYGALVVLPAIVVALRPKALEPLATEREGNSGAEYAPVG